MPEETQIPGPCAASHDGVCAVHGIEIERRRSSDKHIEEVKATVASLAADIARLTNRMSKRESFSAQVRVVGIIALAIYAGGFLYTYISNEHHTSEILEIKRLHSIDIDRIRAADDKLQKAYDELDTRVGHTEASLLVNEQKFIRLLERIDVTNKRLTEILDRLPKEKLILRSEASG